ncbi:hypothetical protein [Motiliproteus sp. SC1-56]|uniref:hypothetical protein n=1 Tax=Motiliproteus sp. SC1-56 TaxID=2799565 RepID=UPI001A8D7B25|nr:hypothetical protein [Motiliproteus sp. SC1-56]
MSETLDQRYMQVAQACLKVLNNINPAADRSEQIKEVYAAIDRAVGELYKQQETQLATALGALRQIAEMDPAKDHLDQAVTLARAVVPVHH